MHHHSEPRINKPRPLFSLFLPIRPGAYRRLIQFGASLQVVTDLGNGLTAYRDLMSLSVRFTFLLTTSQAMQQEVASMVVNTERRRQKMTVYSFVPVTASKPQNTSNIIRDHHNLGHGSGYCVLDAFDTSRRVSGSSGFNSFPVYIRRFVRGMRVLFVGHIVASIGWYRCL